MNRERINGIIKRHPDGFGFLIPENSELPDVYVGKKEMAGVMTNDKVEVTVLPEKDGNRFYGVDLKVVKRSVEKIVGKIKKQPNGDAILEDKGNKWGADVVIPFRQSRASVDGDLVAIEITEYPQDRDDKYVGRVVEIIGDSSDPLTDVKRVLHIQNIPTEFSQACLHEARSFGEEVKTKDKSGRKDLTQLPLITIDGVTAKDFDDAVCVRPVEGGFNLWVAIADVSHYVKPGSSLDDDAYKRGTSVYFPNFVVPMLPEELSNGLCSLKPLVDRLCFVCEMKIDYQGVVTSSQVYEAVMHSHARVTYGEAQEILNGNANHANPVVEENIKRCSDLAKILMAKRFREGSLDLAIPETEIILDDLGQVMDIIKAERVFSHKLIEELMLIANVSVAKIIAKHESPGIYRIHEEPDQEDVRVLQRFLESFGSEKKLSGGLLQKKITKSLQKYQGKPEGLVLSILTLRSMMQAKYSTNNVGHFGLGFEFYTHFTSPIRRYPDLVVHRILKVICLGNKDFKISEDNLTSTATLMSACEQRSVKAERQFVGIKKARFMEKFIGEECEGFISSVTKFGVFVLLREYDVDGLVKVDALGNEPFEFNEETLQLVGKKTKLTYKIGDPLKVQVAAVNTDEGQIDFVIPGVSYGDNSSAKKPRQDHKKRFTPKGNSGNTRKIRFPGRRSKNKA